MLSKKLIALTLLVAILGGALLTACAGGASIDVNVDPETGQGTIDIIGSDSGGGQQSDGTVGGMSTNNVIILAVVVALFLAIIALVIALVSRKPNQ
ncbi:MAG: hypothetical protein KIT70_07810 [Anaerolineales bacterium]|nr:MAG: hypothetical protein KIT70_07810 [Anaerolineales bacterium]